MTTIYLANLTHVNDGHYSSDYIPLNIGYLSAFTKTNLNVNNLDIKLFNLPDDLEKAMAEKTPDILATSSYGWSFQLNYFFLAHYKSKIPSIVTIMGGPNYPGTLKEQELFLKKYNNIDFYVVLEGENTFLSLIKKLITNKFNLLKTKRTTIYGCQYLKNNKFVDGGKGERVKTLENIPSPYLNGDLDKFLEGGFAPQIQTNRGCPFKCTFCHSGDLYFNKLPQFPIDQVLKEIDYISSRVTSNILSIVDDNFGIFKRDKEIAKSLSESKKISGWPTWITVSTSKVNKDQVLDSLLPLRDSLQVSASLQSMDPDTLENVKRKNLTFAEFEIMMEKMSSSSMNTMTELIMPLPGETKKSHLEALEKTIEVGIDEICSYTSMLLPNTPMQESDTYDKFNMTKKYRVLPRDYGIYFGNKIIETECVCVANSSMTFEEYKQLRGLYFVIYSYYNLKTLKEIVSYLRWVNVSIFGWLKDIQKTLENDKGLPGEVYHQFLAETENELWDTEEELLTYYQKEQNFQKLKSGEKGSNLIMKYSTIYLNNLYEFANLGVETLLKNDKNVNSKFVKDLLRYSVAVRGDVFNEDKIKLEEKFNYDLVKLSEENDFSLIENLGKKVGVTFVRTEKQTEIIENYMKRYGSNEDAKGKIINQVGVETLFRKVKDCNVSIST